MVRSPRLLPFDRDGRHDQFPLMIYFTEDDLSLLQDQR